MFAAFGALRMGAALGEEEIVKAEGNPGFSELKARVEGTVESVQEKNGSRLTVLKDVTVEVKDRGRENGQNGRREEEQDRGGEKGENRKSGGKEGEEDRRGENGRNGEKEGESEREAESRKEGKAVYELGHLTVYLPDEIEWEDVPQVRKDREQKGEEARSGEKTGDGEETGGMQDSSEKGEALLPGMRLACEGELESFEPARNEGEFDYRLYYKSKDMCCRMSAESAAVTDASESPLRAGVFLFRERAKKIFCRELDKQDAGLMAAVVLGDKTEMDEEINELYQKNGIAHLLAVSGLHVSLIGMGFYRLLRKIGLGFGRAGAAAGGLLFLYGLMTGFGPSVFRACLMLGCAFLAAYLGRTYDLLSAMALAAVCLAVKNPFVILTGAFQLSFGAVFAIGWAGAELTAALGCRKGWTKALAVSLSIQLVTGPVVLYHFFEYPLYGFFLNFIVIPLMAYVVCAGLFGLSFGLLADLAGAAAAASGGAGSLAAGAAKGACGLFSAGSMGTCHYILAFYELLCRAAQKLPGASLILGRPPVWKLAAYYAALLGALWFLGQRGRKREEEEKGLEIEGRREPEEEGKRERKAGEKKGQGESGCLELERRGRPKPAGKSMESFLETGRTAVKTAAFLSALAGFLLYRPVPGLRVDFIDVGQGDGILFQTKDAVLLVDGGSTQVKNLGEKRLEPLLKSRGIGRIDMAFISHGDQDHISGISWLLENDTGIEIDRILMPLPGKGEEVYKELEEMAEKRGTKTDYICAGDYAEIGTLRLTCIYPYADTAGADRNGHSEVLLAEYGQCSMLLTGDVEEEGEAEITERWEPGRRIQILKAGHHGSSTSSSGAFLDAVAPQLAILSYGKDNSYGHPHEETLRRFEERGITAWATAEHGMITVRTDGREIRAEGFLD